MRTARWSELDPRLQRLILVAGAFDAGLKVGAMIDLVLRPSDEIRGSKLGWAAALTVANSGGVLPIIYLLRGRKTT